MHTLDQCSLVPRLLVSISARPTVYNEVSSDCMCTMCTKVTPSWFIMTPSWCLFTQPLNTPESCDVLATFSLHFQFSLHGGFHSLPSTLDVRHECSQMFNYWGELCSPKRDWCMELRILPYSQLILSFILCLWFPWAIAIYNHGFHSYNFHL